MPANVRRRPAGLADAGTDASRIRGDAPDPRRSPDRKPGRPADDGRPGDAGGHEAFQRIGRIGLSRRRRFVPDDFLLDGQADLSPWHERVLHDRLRRDRRGSWSGIPSLRRRRGFCAVGGRGRRTIRIRRAKGGRTFPHANGGPLDAPDRRGSDLPRRPRSDPSGKPARWFMPASTVSIASPI